jgi:hypothetical protein
MGIVWIRCPATGGKMPTGIRTGATTLTEFPAQLRYSRCPVCGGRHAWTASDAWISRAGPSTERHATLSGQVVSRE